MRYGLEDWTPNINYLNGNLSLSLNVKEFEMPEHTRNIF